MLILHVLVPNAFAWAK